MRHVVVKLRISEDILNMLGGLSEKAVATLAGWLQMFHSFNNFDNFAYT